MKIITVGCGKVGATLVKQLDRKHHDITLIGSDDEALQVVVDSIDVVCVMGNGAVHQVQMEARTKEADLLIATTSFDELNMPCCLIARKAGNCHTIARIRNPEHSTEINYIREELNSFLAINTELAAAREIARLLRFPSVIKVEPFTKGRIELLKSQTPKGPCLGQMEALEVMSKLKSSVLICVVEHGEDAVIPDGNFAMPGGDKIFFIASHSDSAELFRKAGIENNTVNSVMSVGGGRLMAYPAKVLTGAKIKMKIVGRDEERYRFLGELLLEAMIIHGDGPDQQLLLEEGIRQIEAFAPLTGFDEENITLSLYAASQFRAKLIIKVNRITFENVISSLDLGSVIYPKMLTADIILQYVRAMQNSMGSSTEALYKIVVDRAKALEFRVREHSPAVGIPLETPKPKSSLLVVCISRNGKFTTSRDKGVIQIGGSVIIVTTHTGLNDLKGILG